MRSKARPLRASSHDELVAASIGAVKAATDLLPLIVSQYTDRKDLTAAVLVKQRDEAQAKRNAVHEIKEGNRENRLAHGRVIPSIALQSFDVRFFDVFRMARQFIRETQQRLYICFYRSVFVVSG